MSLKINGAINSIRQASHRTMLDIPLLDILIKNFIAYDKAILSKGTAMREMANSTSVQDTDYLFPK